MVLRLLCILSLLSGACAKQRPTERISDVDKDRFSKGPFQVDTPWLQKVTIVKTGEYGAFGFVGLQSDIQVGRFEFSREQLKFLNVRSPYETSVAANNLINSWDISHSDRRLAEQNGKVTNVEEENDEISWQNKGYFSIDWTKASISESASFPFGIDKECWSKASSSIEDGSQEISAEHISFTVVVDYELDENCLTASRYNNGIYTNTLHFKYSFIPLPATEYTAYLYTGENDPLMQKYGYFNSIIPGLAADGRFENKFVMNRWDPGKTHTFYFADDYSDESKAIFNDPATGIIKRANDIFEKHGLTTRFEVKDHDGTKKFGDLRYSFFKIIEELSDSAPLGYGPSDANPFTGEIIAANTMIWTGLLKYYAIRLEEDAGRAGTSFDTSSFYIHLKKLLGADKAAWTVPAAAIAAGTDAGKYFNFLLPQYTYGSPGNGFANLDVGTIFRPNPKSAVVDLMHSMSTGEMLGLLAKKDEVIKGYFEQLAKTKFERPGSTVYSIEHPLADLRQMLVAGEDREAAVQKILYATAIHEFGHNLNLRHNFYGSVDRGHFGEAGGTQSHLTSSVMEYMPLDEDDHAGYGQYDEAALAYAYSSGDIDLAKVNDTTYLYCSDEHANVNALCNRWDSGTTPSEIALSMMERYEQQYWVRNFRNDRAYWSTDSYDYQIFETMWGFKKFVKMSEDIFGTSDMKEKLVNYNLSTEALTDVTAKIQRDVIQSTLLAASFYDAVLQQKFSDRPYTETYESWSGALQQKGIASDKLFASYFLLGDDALTYNPNRGRVATSFLPLRDHPDVGPTITEIIHRNVMDSGDMYLGFNSFSRILYAQSSAGYRDITGSGSSLEQLRIACFSPDNFEKRFNIADVYAYSGNGEPAHVLTFETLTLDNLNNDADYYFRSGTTKAVVINVNGNFYVASEQRNTLAFDLINTQVRHEILEMYMVYRLITEGRIPECL